MAIQNKKKLPEKCVVFTFDDGLREHFETALPILERKKILFIFFVNSMPIIEKRMAMVHKINYLRANIEPSKFYNLIKVKSRDLCKIEVSFERIGERIPPNYYPYDTPKNKIIKYILNLYLPQKCTAQIIDLMFSERFNEKEFCEKYYMNEEQIKEIHHNYKWVCPGFSTG